MGTRHDRPKMLASRGAETELLVRTVRQASADRGHLRILEAGCGQKWPLDLSGISYHLTGVDLDADALAMRVEQDDLDEAIHADLRTAELAAEQFDVIYSSFVIEHIDGAEDVLDNFLQWAKPGAVMLLRFPDRDSAFGFATRVTPHWCHVLYKRWIAGNKRAGEPGQEPYETFYDDVVSLRGFRDYCSRRGLVIGEERGFPLSQVARGFKMKTAVLGAQLLGLLSLGKLDSRHIWLTYIVTKP